MNDVVAVAVGAIGCALAGWMSPRWVRLIPEPATVPEANPEEEPRKQTYAEIADLPWFAGFSMLAGGMAGGVVAFTVGWSWLLVGLLPWVSVCVALAIIDARTRLLPTLVVLPATGALLVLLVPYAAWVGDWSDLLRGVVLMLIGRGFFFVLWFIRSAGMGYGDVRLAALLGLPLGVLGVSQWLIGMVGGFFLFAIPLVVWALIKRDVGILKAAYPFGPAMIAAALIGVAAGVPLAEYLAPA